MTDQRRTIVGIPVKPFGVAKQRLHPLLDSSTRSRLGREVAVRTARAVSKAGAEVVIVTGDDGVRHWAAGHGFDAVSEIPGAGLDGAGAALRDHALSADRPWVVLHADLPLIATSDVEELLGRLDEAGSVIAPSHDGGTSALGSGRHVEFHYGPGSYRRHLSQIPQSAIVIRTGFAFDLDTVTDLERIMQHDRGSWIGDHITAIGFPS